MASRSTVRTPVAVASSASLFASGESSEPGGIDFGSEAMFMPRFYAAGGEGSTRVRGRQSDTVGQVTILREVAEPRKLALELHIHGACGTVALLADNDFGLAVRTIHVRLPVRVFRRAGAWLLVLQVVFLAVHEDHDVGILFDRAGFAKVGQLRTLVVAIF